MVIYIQRSVRMRPTDASYGIIVSSRKTSAFSDDLLCSPAACYTQHCNRHGEAWRWQPRKEGRNARDSSFPPSALFCRTICENQHASFFYFSPSLALIVHTKAEEIECKPSIRPVVSWRCDSLVTFFCRTRQPCRFSYTLHQHVLILYFQNRNRTKGMRARA